MVLRTLARGELPAPEQDRWHFSVQTLDDFLFRMESAQPPAQGVLDLLPEMARSRQPGLRGLSWLGTVRAQPRSHPEWALLPPLRDELSPPPPPRALVAWTALPPLRPGPPLPPPRVPVKWESLPPLRLVAPPAPPLAATPAPASGPALPPLLPPSALTPWQKLPPLRPVSEAALTAVSWQVLPPLRAAAAELPQGPARGVGPLPPLRPGEPPQSPSVARPGGWDALPPLRDAAVVPQRRVPWRRLPPLRDGLPPPRPPTG